MDEKRVVVTLFGVAVASVALYVAYRFIAALTVAVFLYYSTRRFFHGLKRLHLPARVRAAITLAVLSIPLLFLLTYTVILMVLETRQFIERYPVIESTAENVAWVDRVGSIPEPTFEGIISTYQAGEFDLIIDFAVEHAAFLTNAITGFFITLIIVVIVTYYLLVDGPRVRQWLLRFDDDAIVREYLEAADDELEAVLFGNLLNVIAISLIAVAAYMGYNAFVPGEVQVPYPALAGVLTGIASLIPVVGMKIVYGPLAAATAAPSVLNSQPELLVYVLGFLIIAVVIVDTIPDMILRPYFSGKTTHVGLLMLAYILGPVVFGFYGLFFAPILLVLGLTFAHTALPRLLGAKPKEKGLASAQTVLSDFGESE